MKKNNLVAGNIWIAGVMEFNSLKYLFITAILFIFLGIPNYVSAQDQYFDSNGVKIRYVTKGIGDPVVLIHGWMSDSSMWGQDAAGNTELDESDKGFQIIALDCRGHGKSDKPKNPADYGAEMAADVVRLLDHLKIKKAHLVGYSSGAFIAGKIAATHPKRVLSVVYAGQAPIIAETMKPSDFSDVDRFAKAVDENKLVAYLIEVAPTDRPKPTEEQAKAFADYYYADKDVKAFAAAGRSFPELKATTKNLKKYNGPILFMYGRNESEHVKNRVASVKSILKRGEVHVVEGGDHMTTIAKPDFGATLIRFLNSNKSK